MVVEVIAEAGATSPKDMGKVMKGVMARLAVATVDGKAVATSSRTSRLTYVSRSLPSNPVGNVDQPLRRFLRPLTGGPCLPVVA